VVVVPLAVFDIDLPHAQSQGVFVAVPDLEGALTTSRLAALTTVLSLNATLVSGLLLGKG